MSFVGKDHLPGKTTETTGAHRSSLGLAPCGQQACCTAAQKQAQACHHGAAAPLLAAAAAVARCWTAAAEHRHRPAEHIVPATGQAVAERYGVQGGGTNADPGATGEGA